MRTAIALAAVAVAACSGPAEEPGVGNLVVTGADGRVELVDPQTGDRNQLSGPSRHEGPVQPTASPDGSVVVWSATTDAGGPVVRVHHADETRDVDVATLPFFYAFDASSTRVAALGNDPEGEGVALLLIDLTTDTAEILEVGQPYYLDWHPEDADLVVHVGFEELAVLSGTGERTRLPGEQGNYQAPAWTADGRVLAPVRSAGATAAVIEAQAVVDELKVIDPRDGSSQHVTVVEGMVMFEVAADRVAFVEGDTGIGSLAVVGVDGSELTEVAEDRVVAFDWSRDGQLLLFHVVEVDRGLVPHVWDGAVVVEYPPFLPTGVYLTQYLPFWSQYMRTITQWAPDGSAFAYADGEDDPTVWVQPLEGERRDVGEGVMVSWSR